MDATDVFIAQNPHTAAGLAPDQITPYAEHHAGGLHVLGAPTSDGRWVKLHDTWGPGTPDEPGDIVVHAYDPDADSDDETRTRVDYFTDAAAAYDFFTSITDG